MGDLDVVELEGIVGFRSCEGRHDGSGHQGGLSRSVMIGIGPLYVWEE